MLHERFGIIVMTGLIATLVALSAYSPAVAASPGALNQLIEEARKERILRISLPSSLSDKGVDRLIEAFNKKYKLNLEVKHTPAGNAGQVSAQVMMEIKTGRPSWDILCGPDATTSFWDMAQRGLLTPYDWVGTFPYIPREQVLLNGGFVGFAGSYYLPAYNSKLVKPEDVPRRWEDLLNPKWRGKLVGHDSAITWVKLTEVWGEARVTALVEGLEVQKPVLVNMPQVTLRVGSGEYPVAASADLGTVFMDQARGMPISPAGEVKPILGGYWGLVVPQRAQSPSAAKLFVGFQATPEAQQIWWEQARRGLPSAPPMAEWLKGKEVYYGTVDFLQKEAMRLHEKYLKMLGTR